MISVLIPVWRDQAGLDRTLATLAEDATPFDIVVVDDGSTTPITAPEFAGPHPVTLHRLPENRGIEHALNEGLAHIFAKGSTFIARLDCGDVPLPGRIARQAQFLRDNDDVGMVGTWARCIDDDGKYLFTLRLPTDHEAMLRKQRYVPALLHPTIMIRAEALREVGLYSDRYKTAEDYDLFVRMGRKWRLANIPEALTEYIVSTTGTTAAKRKRNLIARFRVQRDNFGWADPHAWLGIARTVAFMVIPFDWMVRAKAALWK